MKDHDVSATDLREQYAEKTKQAMASIAKDRQNQMANGEALVEIFAAGNVWSHDGARGEKIASELPRALTTIALAVALAVLFTL
ncbi:MAG: hypothetical protein AAGM38_01065 [Pseudomonadota bacterium]